MVLAHACEAVFPSVKHSGVVVRRRGKANYVPSVHIQCGGRGSAKASQMVDNAFLGSIIDLEGIRSAISAPVIRPVK